MQVPSYAVKAACLSASLYVVPKVLTYLCTEPTRGTLPPTLLDQLRAKLADCQRRTEISLDALDGRIWFSLTDVLADNAWISVLFIAYLTKGERLGDNFDQKLNTVLAVGVFSTAACATRWGLTKMFPPLGRYIGIRSQS